MPSQRARSSFASFAINRATLSSSRARATAAPVLDGLATFATATFAGGGVINVRASESDPSTRSVIVSASVAFGSSTFTFSETRPRSLPRYSVMNNLLCFKVWKIKLISGSPHSPYSPKRGQPHARAVGPALLRLIRRTRHGNEAWLFGDPRSWLGVASGALLFRVQRGNARPPSRGQPKFPQRGFQNRWVDSRRLTSPYR